MSQFHFEEYEEQKMVKEILEYSNKTQINQNKDQYLKQLSSQLENFILFDFSTLENNNQSPTQRLSLQNNKTTGQLAIQPSQINNKQIKQEQQQQKQFQPTQQLNQPLSKQLSQQEDQQNQQLLQQDTQISYEEHPSNQLTLQQEQQEQQQQKQEKKNILSKFKEKKQVTLQPQTDVSQQNQQQQKDQSEQNENSKKIEKNNNVLETLNTQRSQQESQEDNNERKQSKYFTYKTGVLKNVVDDFLNQQKFKFKNNEWLNKGEEFKSKDEQKKKKKKKKVSIEIIKQNVKCPNHPKIAADLFCLEEYCNSNCRIICKNCLNEMKTGHYQHKSVELSKVLTKSKEKLISQNLEHIFEDISKFHFDTQIHDTITRFLLMFERALRMIIENLRNSVQQELSTLSKLQQFLDFNDHDIFQAQYAKNKELSDLYFQSYSKTHKKQFYQTVKPNKEQLNKFINDFEDKMCKLDEEFLLFLKNTIPKYMNRVPQTIQKYEIIKKKDIKLPFTLTKISSQHSQVINDLKILNDELVMSCSNDNYVTTWNVFTDQIEQSIKLSNAIQQIEKLDTNTYVLLAKNSSKMYFYDYLTNQIIEKFQYKDQINLIQLLNKQIYFGTECGEICILDQEKGLEITKSFLAHTNPICAMTLNQKTKLLISGDVNGDLQFIQEEKQMPNPFLQKEHKSMILQIQFIDKLIFATSDIESNVILWDLEKKEKLRNIREFNQKIDSLLGEESSILITWVIQQYDNDHIILAGNDNIITLYNWKTDIIINEIKGSVNQIMKVCKFNQGSLASIDRNQTFIYIWN